MPKSSQFQRLIAEAKADPNIVGFFLVGSRGKGFENSNSDYDPYMIVKDNVAKKYKNKYKKMNLEEIHLAETGMILHTSRFLLTKTKSERLLRKKGLYRKTNKSLSSVHCLILTSTACSGR